MAFDIAIGLIMVLAMVLGYRAGFVWTFLHMIGWLLSVVLAFVYAPKVIEYLRINTDFYESLHKALSDRLGGSIEIADLTAGFPELLAGTINSLARMAIDAAGTSLADLLFAIAAFLLTLIAIKLFLFLLIHLLSKKFNSGVRGVVDGILGLLIGFVKGIFVVFVLFAVMIPAVSYFDAGLVPVVGEILDSSRVAKTVYDNNILVLIVRDFLF